jgi:hypothetical protein
LNYKIYPENYYNPVLIYTPSFKIEYMLTHFTSPKDCLIRVIQKSFSIPVR